jgi:hypothetical protein
MTNGPKKRQRKEGRRMLRISFVFSWYLATNGLGSAHLVGHWYVPCPNLRPSRWMYPLPVEAWPCPGQVCAWCVVASGGRWAVACRSPPAGAAPHGTLTPPAATRPSHSSLAVSGCPAVHKLQFQTLLLFTSQLGM